MIKIIKEGHIRSIIYRFKCTHCGCIFDMNMDDTKDCKMLSPVRDRYNNDVIYKCMCPCCENRTAIGSYKVRNEE